MLRWELGVEWTVVRRGIAEVAGVPKPVLRADRQRTTSTSRNSLTRRWRLRKRKRWS